MLLMPSGSFGSEEETRLVWNREPLFRLTIENANDDHIGKEIGAGKGSNRSRVLRRLCWSQAVSPFSVSRLPEDTPPMRQVNEKIKVFEIADG